MNLSEDELRMLKELAETEGLTASDYLRLQLRKLYTEHVGSPKESKRREHARDFSRRGTKR